MTHDNRILELRRLVDSGKYRLLSVDIFDTTVWRMVPNPVDVFFLLARDLKQKGLIRKSSSVESFVRERIQAEERSRKKKNYCAEVTLEEIYAEFPVGYLVDSSTAIIADLEFKKECELVRVYPEMSKLLAYAQGKGLKTAFVSDTYFNQHQIGRLVGIDVDYVILSCEHHVSKYHGLHSVLIEQSGISPSHILHVGDNHTSDIKGPEIYPIDTFWFEKFPEPFGDIVELETPMVSTERNELLKSPDYGLTWQRSLAGSACSSDYERWGAIVLGPLISGFSDWVIDRCENENIRTVLCLMREGRILKKSIDTYNTSLETSELFISRYVALKAAIFDGSPEEIYAFISRPSPKKTGEILSELGLCGNDVGLDEDTVLKPDDTSGLIQKICNTPRAKQKVIQSSRLARNNLIKHITEKINPNQKQTVALVDLGYKGTIQENLQIIFDRENLPVKTHGFYFVTGGDVYQTQSTGAVTEGWLSENGQPLSMAHTFMRSPEIVEQSLMADCGTTLGHDDTGLPILDEFIIPHQQHNQIVEIQRGMKIFFKKWVNHKNQNNHAYDPKMKGVYQNICLRTIARPMKIELSLFGNWEHDENLGSKVTRKLTHTKLDEWQLNHISAYQLASLPSSQLYWPFGMASQISPTMGEAVANIFLRRVKPDVFDSCDEQLIAFYWDSGSGFNKNESEIGTFRLNNRNRIWKRFDLDIQDSKNKAIGFSIGKIGDILQLTGVQILIEPLNGEIKRYKFRYDEIEMSGYQRVDQNFYLVNDEPALFIVPTGTMEKFTGTIHADLFFSIMAGQG